MNHPKKQRILLTLDSMKDPNTGFYYFGKALFEALVRQKNNHFDLNIYTKRSVSFFHGKGHQLYYLYKLHKVFFPFFYRFDLIHFSDQFLRLKPSKVKGKKIVTIHDLNQLHQPGFNAGFLQNYIKRLRKQLACCDQIVAISRFVADDISKNFPEFSNKTIVIYNGADELEVDETHQPAYIPQRPFLFALGPLNAKKNFHVLPALLQENDLELVVSGITPEPAYTGKFKNTANEFGCSDRVSLTGVISDKDKAWYYKNCYAFVFPSLAEGFGLPVIEAMHFGKPVFLSNRTSLPEVGGEHAFYFENFEAGYMQKVFQDGMTKFEQEQMSDSIRVWAKRFSWDKTAGEYLALYNRLLQEKR